MLLTQRKHVISENAARGLRRSRVAQKTLDVFTLKNIAKLLKLKTYRLKLSEEIDSITSAKKLSETIHLSRRNENLMVTQCHAS